MAALFVDICSSDDDVDEIEMAALLAAEDQESESLAEEEIDSFILKDRLIARLTSHASSILEVKKVFVSDLVKAFNDHTLQQQVPTYLVNDLVNIMTPRAVANGPHAIKNICKCTLLMLSLILFFENLQTH